MMARLMSEAGLQKVGTLEFCSGLMNELRWLEEATGIMHRNPLGLCRAAS